MFYTFESASGDRREFEFGMLSAPEIGARIRRGGRSWRRIPDAPEVSVERDRHFAAHQLPSWYEHAPRHDVDGSQTGVPGTALFDGPSEVSECIARANDQGEKLGYD